MAAQSTPKSVSASANRLMEGATADSEEKDRGNNVPPVTDTESTQTKLNDANPPTDGVC